MPDLNRYPYSSSVTRVRRQVIGRDRYGNDKYSDVETPIDGAIVWPLEATERTDERQQVFLGMKMVLPDGYEVLETDRFRIGNKPALWEVNSARDWRDHKNPWTNDESGWEVVLQRVTG